MKNINLFIIIFAVAVLAFIACDDEGSGSNVPDTDIDTVGSISVITGNGSSSVSSKADDSEANAFYYITGRNIDGEPVLQEQNLNTGTVKVVSMDGTYTPPGAYPNSFELNNIRYLLFSEIDGDFYVYVFQSEDEESVYFAGTDMWDFSNIKTFIEQKDASYTDLDNSSWLTNPCYSVARNTLYFTVAYWEEDINDVKLGDYIKMRIFESELSGSVFSTPTEAQGEIDPYDSTHYVDGAVGHDQDDFLYRLGIFWIGRIYITSDGNKAFFTSMNPSVHITIGADYNELLNPDCPFIGPTPNELDPQGLDLYDPALIDTFILSAEIDVNGRFFNVEQLPPYINRGGVNFVCDISADGEILYVAHMLMDDEFWSYGWGPDGMVMQLTKTYPWEVEPWDGVVEKVDLINETIENIIY